MTDPIHRETFAQQKARIEAEVKDKFPNDSMRYAFLSGYWQTAYFNLLIDHEAMLRQLQPETLKEEPCQTD